MMKKILNKKNVSLVNSGINKKLGLFIAMARKEAGFTQSELSIKLNTSQNQIARWETGKYEPPPSTIQKIADYTNKPMSYFFGEQQQTPPNPYSEIADLRKQISLLREELNEYKTHKDK